MKFIYRNRGYYLLLLLIGGSLLQSCSKSTELTSGPYFNAPKTAVNFFGKKPTPEDGKAGDRVSYQISGLGDLKGYSFYINQVKAEVVKVSDSLITVIIPEGTSSGAASVLTDDGQYYYGPILKIDGRVSIDQTFKVGTGTNGTIYSVYYNGAGNGVYVLGGLFTDFNNQSVAQDINSLVKISSDGSFLSYEAGKGSMGGMVNTILPVSGQLYIGGAINAFGNYDVSGLTRLNDDCSIDSMVIDVVNPDQENHPENSTDTVPALNAYLSGRVVKLFQNDAGQLIAVGNFYTYSSYYYERSQKGIYYTDITPMNNFVRFDEQGVLDSSYNFNLAIGKSNPNLNGDIADAIQLPNKKIIFVGSFTGFNGTSAQKIAALTNDGKQDPDFAVTVGSGADGDIYRITYNATTKKILITGAFTHYDGHKANGIALLNEDGSFDDGFTLRETSGGKPNYAGQLNNGKVIVSGTFNKYDGVVRQGFMILNDDGSLAEGFNNTGTFSGIINGIVEPNNNSVVIYGEISLFDNIKSGNILRIAFD